MIIEGEDGITHINIYSKAKTELGRFLSNFALSPIKTKEHGGFQTIEGYWYWLLTKDERLRNTNGWDSKYLGRKILGLDFNLFSTPNHLHVFQENSEEFKNYIKNAIQQKIKSYPKFLKLLKDSTLPLCHYYQYGDKRGDAGYEWIIEFIKQIRNKLKES